MLQRKLDLHAQKYKIKPLPLPYIKINLKWTKDLNTRSDPIKLLEEDTRDFKILVQAKASWKRPQKPGNKMKTRRMLRKQESEEAANRMGKNICKIYDL